MDRKTIKQANLDVLDVKLNAQEIGKMMADLELKTMELALKIDKCKDKKKKARMEKKLDNMMRIVYTLTSGNVSFLNH